MITDGGMVNYLFSVYLFIEIRLFIARASVPRPGGGTPDLLGWGVPLDLKFHGAY